MVNGFSNILTISIKHLILYMVNFQKDLIKDFIK